MQKAEGPACGLKDTVQPFFKSPFLLTTCITATDVNSSPDSSVLPGSRKQTAAVKQRLKGGYASSRAAVIYFCIN